jgi:hypothetical protein
VKQEVLFELNRLFELFSLLNFEKNITDCLSKAKYLKNIDHRGSVENFGFVTERGAKYLNIVMCKVQEASSLQHFAYIQNTCLEVKSETVQPEKSPLLIFILTTCCNPVTFLSV